MEHTANNFVLKWQPAFGSLSFNPSNTTQNQSPNSWFFIFFFFFEELSNCLPHVAAALCVLSSRVLAFYFFTSLPTCDCLCFLL